MRWLFADQLGPHFLGGAETPGDDGAQRVLLIESMAAFRRRRYHRAKAHVILSAMRHRAAELGDRARLIQSETYGEVIRSGGAAPSVVAPTSWPARSLVRSLGCEVLPARGFLSTEVEFEAYASGRKRLVMEDFYRGMRRKRGVLMDGEEPVGGRWNFDEDNRQPPPRGANSLGLPPQWTPTEDEIDESVRADMDAMARSGIEFVGADGPRLFAVTRAEALDALADFLAHRLATFGPYEDAVMSGDWVMSHSLLSVPLNLGLLSPDEVIQGAVGEFEAGRAPLSSVEGFVRQVMGWREYVWQLYWYFGPEYSSESNALSASTPLPLWWRELAGDQVRARCLSAALEDVNARGWTHHIPRLMILGNWALQRGYRPNKVNEWFIESFADAYPWVMSANVIGMALYADGGRMATKPYAAGGAYIKRMTNYCGDCAYRPDVRVGERACPFTAGYWWFLDRNREVLRGNHRMAQALKGLDRLSDLGGVRVQEDRRGDDAP